MPVSASLLTLPAHASSNRPFRTSPSGNPESRETSARNEAPRSERAASTARADSPFTSDGRLRSLSAPARGKSATLRPGRPCHMYSPERTSDSTAETSPSRKRGPRISGMRDAAGTGSPARCSMAMRALATEAGPSTD